MKLVNFSKIKFEDNDLVDDDYHYESVEESIEGKVDFGWIGTFKKNAIVKNVKDNKLYKTFYYICVDEMGSTLSCGIDGDLDCGGNGYCELKEVNEIEAKKIDYEECDDGEEIDERDDEIGEDECVFYSKVI